MARSSRFSFFSVETEVVRLAFFVVPYPTATTSSKLVVASTRVTSYSDFPLSDTSWVRIPTKEKISDLAFAGTFIVKLPKLSVVTPMVVPFTTTDTPGTGVCDSSVTFPAIFLPVGCSLRKGSISSLSYSAICRPRTLYLVVVLVNTLSRISVTDFCVSSTETVLVTSTLSL